MQNMKAINEPNIFLDNLNFIIGKMGELINKTEDYYGVIHENLPAIERNIELTKQETSILVKYFLSAVENSDLQGDAETYLLIAHALKDIKNNFQEISKNLLDEREAQNILDLFIGNNGTGTSFDSVVALINSIGAKLTDVSEISLNSIIFSSRLGNEGLGFRVISDHIYQTSMVLEKEFSLIGDLLKDIDQYYKSFQDMVRTIVDRQKEARKEYIGSLSSAFISLTNSINAISKILENLIENVEQVIKPFEELMVLIQRQDIIRQNMENNIKCLSILRDKYEEYMLCIEGSQGGEANPERILDLLVFVNKGVELAEKITFSMSQQLEESLDEIKNTIGNTIVSFNSIREDAHNLALYFGKNQEPAFNNKGAVDLSFKEIFNFMDSFLVVLREISSSVKNLKTNKDAFYDKFAMMEKSMDIVLNRASMLGKIKVLAKIELARMNMRDNAFGQQLEIVSDNVVKTLSQNNGVFANLKNNLKKDMESFEKIIVENQVSIDQALAKVDSSVESLKITNTIVDEAIHALDKEIDKLYHDLDQVNKRFQGADEIKSEILTICQSLGNAKVLINEEKEGIMARFQTDQWQEKDGELIELFNIFTSYLERFTAKEFFKEASLDEGSEEGDLTLF